MDSVVRFWQFILCVFLVTLTQVMFLRLISSAKEVLCSRLLVGWLVRSFIRSFIRSFQLFVCVTLVSPNDLFDESNQQRKLGNKITLHYVFSICRVFVTRLL